MSSHWVDRYARVKLSLCNWNLPVVGVWSELREEELARLDRAVSSLPRSTGLHELNDVPVTHNDNDNETMMMMTMIVSLRRETV